MARRYDGLSDCFLSLSRHLPSDGACLMRSGCSSSSWLAGMAASLRRAGKGGVALRATVSANAAAFAADLAPVLADIRAAGHTSLRAIAAELTARGIKTRRGGMWSVGNVRDLLRRLERQDHRTVLLAIGTI